VTVTEKQWLTAREPASLLAHARLFGDERKRRLFACACARRVADLFTDPASERAVATAERYADGLAGKQELEAALAAARDAVRAARALDTRQSNAAACAATAANDLLLALDHQASQLAAYARAPGLVENQAELRAHAELARDLFGNPFRPQAAADPAWLEWDGGAVRRLAQAVYDERAFDDLPVLADALEEAGCEEGDLLAHLRGPGPHVLGCWALDLLLAKGRPRRTAGNGR
jgi:hypothetical protein